LSWSPKAVRQCRNHKAEPHPNTLVLSRDERTGETSLKRVTRTMVHRATELVHVRTAEGTITATPNHPFRVVGRGWVAAGDLIPGDTLYLADGGRASILSVTREKLASPVDVYNLEVEDFHTYFVASAGVWVHNCGDGNPLSSANYTPDIQQKMSQDIFHGFPTTIDRLANSSHVAEELGGDGAMYTHVRIPGAINGYQANYHYVIDSLGDLTHRFFDNW
jgi:hypothetical protein